MLLARDIGLIGFTGLKVQGSGFGASDESLVSGAREGFVWNIIGPMSSIPLRPEPSTAATP